MHRCREESLDTSQGPSRLGGGRALVGSGAKPFPLITGLLMAIKYEMTLGLVIK